MGGKVFPLLEVSSSPGHGRGWREAALGLTWPIQWPVEGGNDIIVKRGSKVSGWDGGTAVEMQMFYKPDSLSSHPGSAKAVGTVSVKEGGALKN